MLLIYRNVKIILFPYLQKFLTVLVSNFDKDLRFQRFCNINYIELLHKGTKKLYAIELEYSFYYTILAFTNFYGVVFAGLPVEFPCAS